MMEAVLSNADHPEYGVATIPLPIPRNQYDHCVALLEALEIGDASEADCRLDSLDSALPVLNRLVCTKVNLDELDYLAKRLDSFTVGEFSQFQAMAEKLNLTSMKDLINLTFCCQQATVITDFTNLKEVGRDHYMNIHGGCASMEELEQLDGVETAVLLIEDNEGTITRYGVVYDNGMQLSQLFDGKHLPCYHYRNTTGFRYETLTEDPQIRKAVDDIILDFSGEENPRRACSYGLTEKGMQMLRDVADPSLPHTYSWFVMTGCNTPQEQLHRNLTLDEAVELYQNSDYPEKRLGVTKDDFATVDFVRMVDGEQTFFGDYQKLESFKNDPTIFEAVEQLHQELEDMSQDQGMTM